MDIYSGAIIGKKGVDDFWFKLRNGEIIPWPTLEEIEENIKDYPIPSDEEIDLFYKKLGIEKKHRPFLF